MAYDCESAKAELLADYIAVEDNNWDAYWYLFDAATDWNGGFDHLAIGHIIDACNIFFGGINALTRKDTNYAPPHYIPYLWENCTGAVTWEAIVEAWISNDFEGRAPTIAVIDRMRQILWDEPFSVRWAARPEIDID